ncbi:MAG TPA: hypothetical protein VGC90_11110 [Candidatus Limnocylindrales bacterium]
MIRSSRRLPLALATIALLVAACTGEPQVLATIHIDPTPTPTARPPTQGEKAAEAFFKRVQSGKLTYHAAFRGEIAGAISGLVVVGTIDVAGDDYSEALTFTFLRPPTVPVAVRSVGDRRWVQVDRGGWQKVNAAVASNNPFADVSAVTGTQLVRTEHVGAKDLHHIILTGGLIIAPDLIPAGNLTNEKINSTNLEVVIDDAGTPLTATWQLDGEARVSGQLQGLRVDIDMTFTNVDSKMTIKAP